MYTRKLICFLFLLIVIVSAQLSEKKVDTYLRNNNYIPQRATIKSYKEENGKSTITYQDNYTKYKFILSQNQVGNLFVIFKEQFTQINLFNNFGKTSNKVKNSFSLPRLQRRPTMDMNMNMMMMDPPIPVHPFNFNMRKNQLFSHRKGQLKNRLYKDMKKQFTHECKLNKEQIKKLLQDNLSIFNNITINNMKKNGFRKGAGFLLDILFTNDNKEYLVKVGYLPKYKKLTVLKLQQWKQNSNPTTDATNQVTETVDNKLPFYNQHQNQPDNVNFENIVQSFVEKLMLRRNLQVPQQVMQKRNEEVNYQMTKPLLLGSEGEPEKPQEEPNQEVKTPDLLGEPNEPGNPSVFQETVPGEKQKEEGHSQQSEEVMTELVDEVLGKLKLRFE